MKAVVFCSATKTNKETYVKENSKLAKRYQCMFAYSRDDSRVATWCLQLRCIEFALSQLAVFLALIFQTDGRLRFQQKNFHVV